MHKLERGVAPSCLSGYKHGQNHWRDVTPDEKADIWRELDKMQVKRCAYCEVGIKTTWPDMDSHIEHFRQRSRYPQGTFQWANLFGSCNRKDSCGNHKDRASVYPPDVLINMGDEDPEDFLFFLDNGRVVPANGLSEQQQHRAEETIRLFNLNSSALTWKRLGEVAGYKQTRDDLIALAQEYEEHEWRPLLEQELSKIKDLPFATAIKHVMVP